MGSQEELLIDLLKQKGIEFAAGLSEEEIRKIEKKFEFRFPPDLKSFLQAGLPISEGFAPWRKALNSESGAEHIREWLEWVLEGMLFDVEHNAFWYAEWGKKPEELEAQFSIARQRFPSYPKLVPLYSHRFIPATPEEAGNPIFSVYQMDIIYYGYNLAHYLSTEFKFDLPESFAVPTGPIRKIEFWADCCEGSAFNDPLPGSEWKE